MRSILPFIARWYSYRRANFNNKRSPTAPVVLVVIVVVVMVVVVVVVVQYHIDIYRIITRIIINICDSTSTSHLAGNFHIPSSPSIANIPHKKSLLKLSLNKIQIYKNVRWLKHAFYSFNMTHCKIDMCCCYGYYTRWFKYNRDWFVCKQAALRSSCATLREWSHNLHPPSCSG